MRTEDQDIFADDPDSNTAAAIDAREQDAYWSRFFHLEGYARAGMDYEDYAAAYCVGYIGYVQYGGSFEDAEKSLCSNWVRLKGDSRLSLQDAMPAIRAAWDRMADQFEEESDDDFYPLVNQAMTAAAPQMAVAQAAA